MTHITGKRHLLNGLIRLYAREKRLDYNRAWLDFKTMFRRTYRVDLDDAMDRFERERRKRVNMPAYLEEVGRLDDAIRVAGNLAERKVW